MIFINCMIELNDSTIPSALHLSVSYNIKSLRSDPPRFQTWKLDNCYSPYLRPKSFSVWRLGRTRHVQWSLLGVSSPHCKKSLNLPCQSYICHFSHEVCCGFWDSQTSSVVCVSFRGILLRALRGDVWISVCLKCKTTNCLLRTFYI